MSWLHNMSCPPRSLLELQTHPAARAAGGGRPALGVRQGFDLEHAVRYGIRWPDRAVGALEHLFATASWWHSRTGNRRLPVPVAEALRRRDPIEPWLVVLLLDWAGRETLAAEEIARDLAAADPGAGPEAAVAALEAAAAHRKFRGASLVRELQQPPAHPSTDVALTFLVYAQSTSRVWVAGKQPVLERLRPGHFFLETIRPVPDHGEAQHE